MEYGYQQEIHCPECNNTQIVYGSIEDPEGKMMRCSNCRQWFGYIVNTMTVIKVYRVIEKGEEDAAEKHG